MVLTNKHHVHLDKKHDLSPNNVFVIHQRIINMRFMLLVVIYFQLIYLSDAGDVSKDILRQSQLPPCKACKVLVNSFKKGLERTSKGKFEGGDASWEEEKLGSYAKSEIRLVEIQEKLCSDVEEGRHQCYALHEQHDAEIEEWWFTYQDTEPDVFTYLCIDKLKHCCPDFHFGTNCTPCDGYPNNVCSNNGKCKGSGTRKGSGKCACNEGYSGEKCDQCAQMYFEMYRDETKLLCSKCHPACDGKCTKAGPTGCEKCAVGWIHDESKGCLDVNECAITRNICTSQQFCVNTEGSYKCLNCDHSCAGCTGDGPDMCIQCANGFTSVNNMCVDAEQESRKQHVRIARYLTYLGLCLATCIIFQRSILLAAIVGLAVAAYITTSEYILNSPSKPNATDLADQILKAAS